MTTQLKLKLKCVTGKAPGGAANLQTMDIDCFTGFYKKLLGQTSQDVPQQVKEQRTWARAEEFLVSPSSLDSEKPVSKFAFANATCTATARVFRGEHQLLRQGRGAVLHADQDGDGELAGEGRVRGVGGARRDAHVAESVKTEFVKSSGN